MNSGQKNRPNVSKIVEAEDQKRTYRPAPSGKVKDEAARPRFVFSDWASI